MFENKPTLTKEQQRNVVRWIARGYNINKVHFLRFEKNNYSFCQLSFKSGRT